MPLPPRSVRVSGYHVRRASASPSLVYVDDVRAEMALLPQSAPNASATSGVRLAQIVGRRTSPGSSRPATPRETREVPLQTLIEHGGKNRPPRAGTAQGLGYDVVPRPEVLALDDEHASTDTPRVPRRASPTRSPRSPRSPRTAQGQRSPRLVPQTGAPSGTTGSGTPPLDSTGTSVASTLAGSPRRFWSWGEPVTPKLEATSDEEWEYVDVEDGMVGELELEVVKPSASVGSLDKVADPVTPKAVDVSNGLAYAEVVRH